MKTHQSIQHLEKKSSPNKKLPLLKAFLYVGSAGIIATLILGKLLAA